MLGHSYGLIPVNSYNFEYSNLGHASHFMEGTAWCHINQPLIGHVFQQCLERDFFITTQAEFPRNLSFTSGILRYFDKFKNLIAGG